MSEHQARGTGCLARLGLDVLVRGFSFGWEVDRGDRVAVDLRLGVAAFADRVVAGVDLRGV